MIGAVDATAVRCVMTPVEKEAAVRCVMTPIEKEAAARCVMTPLEKEAAVRCGTIQTEGEIAVPFEKAATIAICRSIAAETTHLPPQCVPATESALSAPTQSGGEVPRHLASLILLYLFLLLLLRRRRRRSRHRGLQSSLQAKR